MGPLLITLFVASTSLATVSKAVESTHEKASITNDIISAAYADPDSFDSDRVASEGTEYVCQDLESPLHEYIQRKCSELHQ